MKKRYTFVSDAVIAFIVISYAITIIFGRFISIDHSQLASSTNKSHDFLKMVSFDKSMHELFSETILRLNGEVVAALRIYEGV